MTDRIHCAICGSESYADGAKLACWKCHAEADALIAELAKALESTETLYGDLLEVVYIPMSTDPKGPKAKEVLDRAWDILASNDALLKRAGERKDNAS
jgi:hypothetical protein